MTRTPIQAELPPELTARVLTFVQEGWASDLRHIIDPFVHVVGDNGLGPALRSASGRIEVHYQDQSHHRYELPRLQWYRNPPGLFCGYGGWLHILHGGKCWFRMEGRHSVDHALARINVRTVCPLSSRALLATVFRLRGPGASCAGRGRRRGGRGCKDPAGRT